MFKSSSFEDEIYRSMEKQLVATQVENNYGFDKLAKAADYLNAAAEVFEKAGMHKQASEVTEVLQELLNQFGETSSFESKAHKRCNCEQKSCDHEAGECKHKAGDKEAEYIGSICDACAKTMPKKYMKKS
jgi:hypothetical protein